MPLLPLPPGVPDGSAAVAVAGVPGQAPLPQTDKEVRLFRPVYHDADFTWLRS